MFISLIGIVNMPAKCTFPKWNPAISHVGIPWIVLSDAGKVGVAREKGEQMSHFTRLRTKLFDEALVRSALESMGYSVLPVGQGVGGWLGATTSADFKVRLKGTKHEVGFVRGNDGFEVVADWYGVPVKRMDFIRELTRTYAIDATKIALAQDGYQLQEETSERDGTVRLVLTRYTGM